MRAGRSGHRQVPGLRELDLKIGQLLLELWAVAQAVWYLELARRQRGPKLRHEVGFPDPIFIVVIY